MGHTQYWIFKQTRGLASQNETNYQKAVKDCQRIILRYYKELGGLSGYSAHTKLGQYGGINVNGKGDLAHETFALREHFNQNFEGSSNGFEFCKTDKKPYDFVVCACLAVLAYRLGDAVQIKSDASAKDWTKPVAYAQKVLGLKIKNPIVDRVGLK